MKKILPFLKKYRWIFSGDFFRVWSGALASQMASMLFYFSLIWWSIEVLGSPLHGGIMIGIGTGVSVLISPLSGWMADRFHRGKIMAISDLLSMFAFLVLVLITFMDITLLWVIYFIRILISLVNAPVNPSFRSLLPEVVENNHLEKAVAFQGSIMQILQLAVPILAGGLTAFLAYEWVWLICAFLVGFSSLWEWFIRDHRGAQKNKKLTSKNLSAGFKQLMKNRPLRLIAVTSSMDQLIFSGFPIYIAVWSLIILEGGTLSTGSLQTFWATGVLITSVLMTFLAKQSGIKNGVTISSVMIGLSFLSIAFIPSFWFASLALLIAGAFSGIVNIYLESFLQRASEGKTVAEY